MAITHLDMDIDFQTSDHVETMKKVAEQCISTICSMCNNFQVINNCTHLAIVIDSQFIHHIVAMEKVAKQIILTK